MEPFTVEQFKACLPDKMQKSVNPALIAKLTKTLSEPDMFEAYRENLVSYTSVMSDGRFKLPNYIDAVKYVSHKLRGASNIAAYSITFPDKIKDWAKRGVSSSDVASYVCSYNKSKLVNLIMEQTLVPVWVLNQDLFQRAINTQAELMLDSDVSPKVRSDAANSLLTHLKPPESKKIELDIGMKRDSSIEALRTAMMDYVAEQRAALAAGVTTPLEAAHRPVMIDNETAETVE
jgi:hypothetical protein